MDPRSVGLLIRQMRLANDWSQEGLCHGICAVSYLSKIEQGKAAASDEILLALLGKLGISWSDDPAHKTLIERCYDALFSGDVHLLRETEAALDAVYDTLQQSPYFLDAMLLQPCFQWWDASPEAAAAAAPFESAFSSRQRTLWLLIQNRTEEAAQLMPCTLTNYYAGQAAYNDGAYLSSLEYLQRAYTMAAENGYAWRMLDSKFLMMNCYSNMLEYDKMLEHAQAAQHLARALGDTGALQNLEYNLAATALELGQIQQAYDMLIRIEEPNALTLHKLAICCEKLGKPDHARRAIDLAPHMPCSIDEDLFADMCAVIRYRLDHPDYLHKSAYGELLLNCFDRMRLELSVGYASFHLPWVLEWYTATRQYRKAYELLQNFPAYKYK